MSHKTLAIGLPMGNPKVTCVRYAVEAPSLFDFELVIADIDSVLPPSCQSQCPPNEYMTVRSNEYHELKKLIDRLLREASFLLEKGGLLVCIMKPKRGLSYNYYDSQSSRMSTAFVNNYDWIPIENLNFQVEYGSGKGIKTSDRLNAFNGYLQMNETFWTAYFENVDGLGIKYKTVGLNDANKPVAIEFYKGKGVIDFQPCSTHPRAGDILLCCALTSSQKAEEIPPPNWIDGVTVPNEVEDLRLLTTLKSRISELQSENDSLDGKIRKETRIKKLLYEKNFTLENIVKESFEELGFTCEKKEKDDKDWIVRSDMGDAILEVTGSENAIDIRKFRQLLNYLLDETKETAEQKKAILVANHFADMPLDKRGEPFSKKAIDESEVHSICLMPTSELFSLICYLRLGKITRKDAQKRILETVGVFQLS